MGFRPVPGPQGRRCSRAATGIVVMSAASAMKSDIPINRPNRIGRQVVISVILTGVGMDSIAEIFFFALFRRERSEKSN